MEMLDIVDERNVVIGQIGRDEAHEKHILHRSVGVLIFRDRTMREMVLQLRGRTLRTAPGRWADIAGHVSAGETPHETAMKELQEEAFYEMQMPRLELEEVCTFRKNSDSDPEFRTTFVTYYDGEFAIDGSEVEAWKWVKTKELVEDVERNPSTYSETFCATIRKLKELGILSEKNNVSI